MKNLTLWGVSTLLLSLVIYISPVRAAEYAIPEIHVEVQINADGTIRIIEHRTYQFDGSFSWANIELTKSGFSAIRDIQVSEGDQSFTNLDSEEPGTFLVQESDEAFDIRWFYEAEDEERVFSVSYILEGALVVGPEWSELFWNYASARREKPTDRFAVSINLPGDVAQQDLHSWIREPRSKMVRKPAESDFAFQGTDITRHEAVIIRVVFPASIFDKSRVAITDPGFSLSGAEEEEVAYRQEQQRKAEEEAYNFALGIDLAVIIAGLSILCFVFLYRKYGTRHKINLSPRQSIMIPGNQKPAIIGWLLMHRNVTAAHLMATLLDLARRDYLIIKEKEKGEDEKKWGSEDTSVFSVSSTDKNPAERMPGWELDLLTFVRGRIQDGKEEIDEIFKFTSMDFSKWFSTWKKKINEEAMALGWIDRESYKGMYWNLGIQLVLVIAAILAAIFLHEVVLFSAAASLITILLTMVIIRRTPRGEEIYQTWKAYREALKNASEYSIPKDHLGRHFIYSTAFGLGQKSIEELFEENPEAVAAIYWVIFLPGTTHSSPADIASSFSTLVSSGTASASGGSVTGGGASAGVAGGGTSGGAG